VELTVFEQILVLALPVLYLGPFFARNLIVKRHIRTAVKARNPLLTAAIVLSTCNYVAASLSAVSPRLYTLMGSVTMPGARYYFYGGLLLFGASVMAGWFVSGQLRDSWRVGVSEDHVTALVTDGVYARVRNPYFVTILVMYFGLLLTRPSIVLLFSVLATAVVFHLMTMNEERHLRRLHGEAYERYKRRTGRYLPRL